MQELSPPHSHHNNRDYSHNQEQQQTQNMMPLIQKMIFYLKQQQLAPVLQTFREKQFQKLRQVLKEQEENLKIYKKNQDDPDTTNFEKNYKHIIYSMEIQKISFILKHYLKIRLDKIQKCSFYYFKDMALAERLMSKSEIEFMKKYVDLRYKYYEKNVFKHIPKGFKGVGGMQLFYNKTQEVKLIVSNQSMSHVIQPDSKSYVFVKMNRNPNQFRYQIDVPIYNVPQQESQMASSNDILFIPYGVAKSLMDRSQQGDLVLM